MIITTEFSMVMDKPNVVPVIHAMQCDTNSRAVAVTLTAAGVPWEPPAETVVSVAFKKPDGKRGWYDKLPNGSDACSVSGNVVTAILAPEMLTAVGRVEALIVFQDVDMNQLSTSGFVVNVEKNPAAGSVISNDYYAYSTMADVSQAMEDFFAKAEEDRAAFQEQAEKAHANIREEIAAVDGSSAIVCEASGDVIAVSDAGNRLVQGLKVYGKTTQATTTGKNLLAVKMESRTADGITWAVQMDGSIKVSGTAVTDTWIRSSIPFGDSRLTLMSPGTYFLSGVTAGSGIHMYVVAYRKSDGSPCDCPHDIGSGATYIFTEDVYAYIQLYAKSGTTVDMVIYPQLEAGSTATAYEPYTGGKPSPNPDFPQELVSVGDSGNVGLTVAGKNLFSGFIKGKYLGDSTGLEQNKATAAATDFIPVAFDDTTYMYLSGLTADLFSCVYAYDNDRSAIGRTSAGSRTEWLLNKSAFHKDFGSTKAIAYIRIAIYQVGSTSGTIDMVDALTPQLEYGNTATECEPYKGQQTLTIPTPNGLPGIPVTSGGNYTDENGQQYIADYRDGARGVDVQRVKKSALSNLLGINKCSDGIVVARFAVDAKAGIAPLSSLFRGTTTIGDWQDKECVLVNAQTDGYVYMAVNASRIGIDTNTATTSDAVTAVRNYLNEHPVDITYVTTTPIETPIPEEELAAYRALHTNKPNTTVFNDAGAHMELEYVADTKLYIDNKFAELSAAIVNNT